MKIEKKKKKKGERTVLRKCEMYSFRGKSSIKRGGSWRINRVVRGPFIVHYLIIPSRSCRDEMVGTVNIITIRITLMHAPRKKNPLRMVSNGGSLKGSKVT